MRGRAAQKGVTLVEVLIAVFIATVGLLGSAVMQVSSIKYTQESLFRSQAVRMAQTRVDNMKTNPDAVDAGAYSNMDTDMAATSSGCLVDGCSPAALAVEDLAQWAELLNPTTGALPLLPARAGGSPARGTISTSANGVHTITLRWNDGIGDSDVDTSYTLKYRL